MQNKITRMVLLLLQAPCVWRFEKLDAVVSRWVE